ncbi:MAG: type II toxin-antitoxin system RelB/DinJ family antitoxin [Verrucomicrobia bacterium]|nr:type II toxin-antitoxin system RelB/DinJ family antitoxin [Verrucomicrobiota bacterium]
MLRLQREVKNQLPGRIAMRLSISDAIRLLMLRVVAERRLRFEVKAPNATTRKAMAQLEARKGKLFTSTAALMADLNEDD